jgi:tetratricopeptide (TPR) repeat protein
VERQPELLALHLEAGGQTADAIRYWHRAGDRLLRRAAYAEATDHLRRGLAALDRLPASAERDHSEIELLTTLGTVLFSTKGYADPDVENTFGRARALCEQAGEDVSLKILAGIMGVYITRNDRGATETLLPQFHRLAERRSDAPAQVTAYATLGQDAFWRGEHVRARDYLDRARSAYLTDEFGRFARDYGYDGGVFSCTYRMWNLWALGYPVQAAAAYQELTGIAARSFDPYTLPLVLGFGIVLAHACRDADATLARAEELVVLATEQKLFFWLALGLCGRGEARTLQGRPGDGIEDLQRGLSLLRMIGVMISYGYHLTSLAATHMEMGQIAEGQAAVAEGLDLCAHGLGRFHEPELLRLQGELLRREGRPSEAEAPLRRAVILAQERGAKAWAIRAATSLGDLLVAEGDRTDAARVVTAAYDVVPEGSDLPDIADARTLLAGLT